MYLDYWNLREAPFQNVADSRFAFLCSQHHEGLARLVYLVQNHKLGGILTGPYGVGKTMVLELLAQQVSREHSAKLISIDYLEGSTLSLARQVLKLLGFPEAARQITEAMDAVGFLREERGRLTHTALIIDEAQNISDPQVYHFLHLLMNITLPDREGRAPQSAFTLILAGYNDMTRLITQDESICQRLQMVWHLDPLHGQQILEYVQHRVRVAGGDIWIFEPDAIQELSVTRGIPRIINNVCDVALMLGYAANARSINRTLIRQALSEASPIQEQLGALVKSAQNL